MELDSKDMLILEVLKENSRCSVKEISKKTRIRPSTVHQRLKLLVKNKVIEKFTVKLNDTIIREKFIVFMLVKGGTGEYLDKSVVNSSRVKEIFGITGEYDLLVKMKFSDVERFNEFILNFRGKKGITSTMTMVATAKIKE